MAEYYSIKSVIVAESTPTVPTHWENDLLWLQPSASKWYIWNGSAWILSSDPWKDVKLQGTVTIDDLPGVTKTVLNPTKIKVHKGLIVEIS